MPKKKKGISKTKQKKIKEIKKKKKIVEKKSEINFLLGRRNWEEPAGGSPLEKNIKEADKIEESGFEQSFTQIETNSRAPVLERVQTQKALELNLPNSQQENKEDQTRIDYTTSPISENEPRYNDFRRTKTSEKKYESIGAPVLESTRLTGRNQEVLMRGTEPRIEIQENNEPRFTTETLEQERRMPFEPEQKKYRKVNL